MRYRLINGITITLTLLSVLFGVISCNKKEAPEALQEPPEAPINLTAVAYNNRIQLSWDKVSNSDYYSITVGFQKRDHWGAFNGEIYYVSLGDTPNVYFTDIYPFEGVCYYLVQAVNEYGTSSYSEVSCYYSNPLNDSINAGNSHGVWDNWNGVALCPNPSDDSVCLNSRRTITRIVVESLEGQVVWDRSFEGDTTHAYIPPLDAGIYLAHVFTEVGEVVLRFVITQG